MSNNSGSNGTIESEASTCSNSTPQIIPESTLSIVHATFLCCSAVLCFTGNTLVLISLKRYRSLWTPANVILGSLAMSDLLMTSPLLIMSYSLAARDVDGAHADIQAGLSTTLIASSSLHIALVSIDRFVSIHYALRYISLVTMSRVSKLLALIWSAAVTLIAFVLLLTAVLTPDSDSKRILFYRKLKTTGMQTHEFQLWVIFYKSLILILFFVFPFTTMTVSYAYIAKVAYVKRRSIGCELIKITMVNSKCTKTIFIVVALYSMLNSPYSMASIIQLLGKDLMFDYYLRTLLVVASLASVSNPFIYAYRDRHFKQAFKKILTCK